jgi:hypothetical protein
MIAHRCLEWWSPTLGQFAYFGPLGRRGAAGRIRPECSPSADQINVSDEALQ